MHREQLERNQAVQKRTQELRQESPSRSALSETERMRQAVERQSGYIHERNKMQYGEKASYSDARKQAEKNAEKLERQRRGE
jgi:hypothetical protein